MNIAELSIRKAVINTVMTVMICVVGLVAFDSLSRLEDPEFTIKDAVITTPYPGASAQEVEEEVTNVIEKAVQEMGQLFYVRSTSQRGLSIVRATMKDKFDKSRLPQVWDELRRKVNDNQNRLPPGAGPSLVNDDFGDVFGIFVAITGDGYSDNELYEYAKVLQRELLMVQDVKRVALWGRQNETIYVEMSRTRMAQLGITQEEIFSALSAKNVIVPAGQIHYQSDYIPINPTGEFTSEQQFGDLLISGGGSDRLIYLRDVANIRRDYADPPTQILRFNGKPAIGLAISTVAGGNVVTMGEGLGKRVQELLPQAPLGMEVGVISLQSEAVSVAINGFLINLMEAVAIVIVVLFLFMGFRSALIIGFILFMTICGTFIVMAYYSIILERISLGALIIALGMLVDNAIVVIDGMKVRIEQGMDRIKAASEVVGQTGVPLLGATIVAIMAFAAIGTSQDGTGEYCRTLFQVIAISLSLSWITAVTTTPLLGKWFIKGPKKAKEGKDAAKADLQEDKQDDPYGGFVFRAYRSFLVLCLRARWAAVIVVIGLFALSMFGFGYVDNTFFPDSSRPQFMVDIWTRAGTHIVDTEEAAQSVEAKIGEMEGVTDVVSMVGGGAIRFLLTYAPEAASANYAQLLVNVDDYLKIDGLIDQTYTLFEEKFPDLLVGVKKFRLGPGEGGRIQLRISGPDHDIVRQLGDKAVAIMRDDPDATTIRSDWYERIKVVRPLLAEDQARRTGITRPQLAQALEESFSGTTTGVYREGDELIPIVARAPEAERQDVSTFRTMNIFSPAVQQMIPVEQVLSGFETASEDPFVGRRNRRPTMIVHCDALGALPSVLLERLKPAVEQELNVDIERVLGRSLRTDERHTAATIPITYDRHLPIKGMPGYFIAWGGENEDSAKAQAALAGSIPVFVGIMILIVVFLFNNIRRTLVIWLTVPLSLIGVTAGLLLFNQPFGFMSLLGLLSLSGMLIKNAIVLIDEIVIQINSGKEPFQAVVDSGVSRMNPVMMAAATTILGMLPLLTDPFFVSMSVTIMFGLGFATFLTLLMVPVFYVIFFRIKYPKTA